MGGSYFIGKSIVDQLQNEYDITILNRGSKENTNPKIRQLISDRNDSDSMSKILQNEEFDIIVDVSGTKPFQLDILLDSLKSYPDKFVFISSSAVYDLDNDTAPFHEDDNLAENHYWTSYGKNKIDCETLLSNKFKNNDTELIVLRPPIVYGENNYAKRESFIFEHIMNGKPIMIPKDGSTRIQFIYTKDLSNIIRHLLTIQLDKVSIFNVGNKEAVSFKEWVNLCEEVVGKKTKIIEFDYTVNEIPVISFFPFYDYDNILEVSRLNKFYSTETPYIEGLRNAYNWYIKKSE